MDERGKGWRIFRNLCTRLRCSVLVDGTASRNADIRQGVRQGCPLSPVLFACYVETLAVRLREVGGVEMGDKFLHSLLYADDVAILAESQVALQQMLDVVDKFCREFRLTLNLSKSKILCVPPRPSTKLEEVSVTFQAKAVETVTEYKYLGLWFTDNLSWSRHTQHVMTKVKKAHANLASFLSHKSVPVAIKRRVWEATTLPKILYGAEIIELSKTMSKKFEGLEHQAATRILKTNKNSNHIAVRAVAGLPNIPAIWAARTATFALKLERMQPTRWPAHMASLPQQRSKISGGGVPLPWKAQLEKLWKQFPDLGDSVASIGNDLDLVNDVDSIGGEDATSPSACIHREWINEQEGRVLQEESKRSRSKATLAALACLSKEGLASPAPITLQPLTPTNRLRIRMLCGTSSLNEDMCKIEGRSSSCPVCDDGLETVEHFLLGCSHRNFESLTASAKAACTCKGPQCVSFLDDASPARRMVFLLGGTVDLPPCPSVDLVSREYFNSAWVTRVKVLQEDSESESSDSDVEPSGGRGLRDYFPPPLGSVS
jgi:hypothetical protein